MQVKTKNYFVENIFRIIWTVNINNIVIRKICSILQKVRTIHSCTSINVSRTAGNGTEQLFKETNETYTYALKNKKKQTNDVKGNGSTHSIQILEFYAVK